LHFIQTEGVSEGEIEMAKNDLDREFNFGIAIGMILASMIFILVFWIGVIST